MRCLSYNPIETRCTDTTGLILLVFAICVAQCSTKLLIAISSMPIGSCLERLERSHKVALSGARKRVFSKTSKRP